MNSKILTQVPRGRRWEVTLSAARTLFRRGVVFSSLLIGLTLVACYSSNADVHLHFVGKTGNQSPELDAEVVATRVARQIGLQYRKELGDRSAMLFVFSDDAPRTFWMKDTLVELDMIFIDGEGRVVSIIERATPMTEDPRPSNLPARYVLEVRGGLSAQLGIRVGSRMVIEGKLPDLVE